MPTIPGVIVNAAGQMLGLSVFPASTTPLFISSTGVLSTASVTGSGSVVLDSSPIILTPTISSFVNANHTHEDSAGGGTLDIAALGGLTYDQIGSVLQAYDADLAALASNSTNGLWARTGAGTGAARTITGTANQINVAFGDGGSGNPTLSTPQDIHTSAIPQFAGLGIGIASPLADLHLSGTTLIDQRFSDTAAATDMKDWVWQVGSAIGTGVMRLRVVNDANSSGLNAIIFTRSAISSVTTTFPSGSVAVGTTTIPSGASNNLVVGGRTLGAATADMICMAAPDNGAGNAEFQVQPELGGTLCFGNDHIRRVPSANHKDENGIVRITTTDGTQTTIHTIAIPTNTTVMIESRFTARRTGGSAGTAGDYASYVRRGTYTNISGTVTCRDSGAVPQTIGTDVEAQAGWDATQTISGTNVLERVTGATNNNVSWSVVSHMHVIAL